MIDTIEDSNMIDIIENTSKQSSDKYIDNSLKPKKEIGSANIKKSRKPLIIALAAFLLVIGAVFGFRYYSYSATHEDTDDAFIEGHVIPISPKVSGHVLKVYVDDNQQVKRGDLLLEIDPRDFGAKLEQYQAELDSAISKQKAAGAGVSVTQVTSGASIEQASSNVRLAKAGVETAHAQVGVMSEKLEQSRAQVKTAQSSVEQAQAGIKAAEAEAIRAKADVQRYQALFEKDEVSHQQLDSAIAASRKADAQLESANKQKAVAEAKMAEALAGEKAELGSLQQAKSQTMEAEARVGQAMGLLNQAGSAPHQIAVSKYQFEASRADIARLEAQIKQTELELSYTKIYAPEDGRITRKAVEIGAFLQVGQPLLAIVPDDVWVIANFKETQLSYMKPGQAVDIKVDAYPDKVFKGHVDSLQLGTGARFSLLPPENATGNYVKVVQRIPVKILFDEPIDSKLLAPGMSVTPEVKTR